MNTVTTWIQQNPVLFTVVLWPLATAIVTALLKPRSPEEYSAMNPRLAAFLKLLGSLGLDAPNVMNALKQLFGAAPPPTATTYRARRELAGQPPPPPPPSGTSILPPPVVTDEEVTK